MTDRIRSLSPEIAPIGTCSLYGVEEPRCSVENVHNPTSSSGPNRSIALSAACLATSSLDFPDEVASAMEPDTSITSRTRARLRWASQVANALDSTAGAGGSIAVNSCSASYQLRYARRFLLGGGCVSQLAPQGDRVGRQADEREPAHAGRDGQHRASPQWEGLD